VTYKPKPTRSLGPLQQLPTRARTDRAAARHRTPYPPRRGRRTADLAAQWREKTQRYARPRSTTWHKRRNLPTLIDHRRGTHPRAPASTSSPARAEAGEKSDDANQQPQTRSKTSRPQINTCKRKAPIQAIAATDDERRSSIAPPPDPQQRGQSPPRVDEGRNGGQKLQTQVTAFATTTTPRAPELHTLPDELTSITGPGTERGAIIPTLRRNHHRFDTTGGEETNIYTPKKDRDLPTSRRRPATRGRGKRRPSRRETTDSPLASLFAFTVALEKRRREGSTLVLLPFTTEYYFRSAPN
jgi:hypothetical protein